ncbi:MAG: glycosyltransferase family 2 protein [Acidobacteria bacterium]|nr:glycosyltransferase family 2 protein [Acidobacteriota bacterium]
MAESPSPKVTLVIPALNEEPVLGLTLASLPSGLFHQVIVADNGSTDATAAVARRHGATVVSEPRRGYGGACLKALAALPPGAGIVVFMQADGSEDSAEARLLLQPILDGRAALVLGSRTLGRAEPGALLPHQAFGNLVATTLIRLLYHHRYTDLGPFRAITVEALRRLNMRDRNYGWTVEMQVRALEEGVPVLEVPVAYRRRAAGVNKVSGNFRASLRAGWVILATILRLRLASASRRYIPPQ